MWLRYSILVVSICVLLWAFPRIRQTTASLCSIGAYPFLCVQTYFYNTYQRISEWIRDRQKLIEERTWYRDMYEQLRGECVRARSALAYSTAVDEIAAFTRRYAYSYYAQTATILFRQCTEHHHICLIDAGENKGIVPNMIVVYKDCLIGRVENVYQYYSKVRLITDKNCHVPVSCIETGTRGIHCGGNATNTSHMLYVSHLAEMQEGDMVVTRAHGIVYPYGFGVGTVKAFAKDGLYYRVTVAPFVDVTTIQYCTVLQAGAEHEISSAT